MAEDHISRYYALFYCIEEIYNFEDFGRRNLGAFRTRKLKFVQHSQSELLHLDGEARSK